MSDILSINISDIVPWSFDWTTLTPRQQGLKIPEIGSHDSWSPPPNPVPMETRTVYWWHFPLPLIHSLKNWRDFLQTTEEKMKYFKFQRRFFKLHFMCIKNDIELGNWLPVLFFPCFCEHVPLVVQGSIGT